jgi:hypothetical protein
VTFHTLDEDNLSPDFRKKLQVCALAWSLYNAS